MVKSDMPLVSQQLFEGLEDAISRGWSINQIAIAAGVSHPSIQNWYSGKQNSLSLETVDALCRFLRVKLTKPDIPARPGDVQEPRRKPKAKRTKRR